MTTFNKNILITGCSGGAGKSYFIKEGIVPLGGSNFEIAISHATRKPRGKEVHGREYMFTTAEDFEKKIIEHFFLEHTKPHQGIYYGSSEQQYDSIRSNGKYGIYDLDFQGFQQLSTGKLKDHFVTVLIKTPVWQRIEWMKKRGDMTEEKIIHRVHYSEKIEMPFFNQNSKRFDVVIEEYTEKTNFGIYANKIINLACAV